MRIRRVLLAGGVLGLAALVHGSGRVGAAGAGRLPAPVTIESGFLLSHRYQIERDGRVRPLRVPRPSYPDGASCCVAPGVWFKMRHGYLMLGRGMRTLWHSDGDLPLGRGSFAFQVVVGPRTVAFLYGNYLYLAPFGGAQRRIGPSEVPLGFTRGGVYTYLWGRRLLLRSDSGAILKTIARVPPNPDDYFVVNGALYFIAHGAVMRAHGARIQRLVSLRHLGLSTRSLSFQPAGRLLELEDNDRLVVLRPDGSVFAWTRLSSRNRLGPAVSVLTGPRAGAVAFTEVTAQTQRPDTLLTHATETVYLLRVGSHTPVTLHRATVGVGECGTGGSLEWHGGWLLYSDGPEVLAAIETTGRHRAIELSDLVKGLPGTIRGFSAYWTGQPLER